MAKSIPSEPPTDLGFYLDLVRGWTRDIDGAPSWSSEVFVEGLVLWPDRPTSISRSTVKTVETFRVEFPALVQSGLSWVQLETWGILDGAVLVIGIAVPGYQSPASVASVNWGGPPRFIQERPGWNLDDLLVITDP